MSHAVSLPRRGLLALAPLLAARCAGLPGQSCTSGPANPLPVGVVQALPFVPVTVSGWPVTALLDTGAERTLVADTLLPALGLPSDPRRQAYQTGATGRTAPRPIATLPRLGVGTAAFRDLEVGVVDRPSMTGPDGNAPQIVLGADILAQHEMELNLPARRVVLTPGQRCRLDASPLGVPSYELPMHIERRRVLTRVRINDRDAVAVLDTGANGMHLSRASTARLGITEAELAAAPQRRVRGINNEVEVLAQIRLDSLRIGPELHRNVPAVVGETLLGDMVIGTPWLLNRRLFVSYANERLFVAIPPGMPAA